MQKVGAKLEEIHASSAILKSKGARASAPFHFTTRRTHTTQGRFDTHKNVVFDPVTQRWIGHIRCSPTSEYVFKDFVRVQCYTESTSADYATTDWLPTDA